LGGGGLGGGGLGGGGLGGGGLGGGGLGGGGGFGGAGLVGARGAGMFRVESGKTKRLKVQTVCLEHGKHDPNPRMKYRLVPLEQLTNDTEIHELCSQLAGGTITQNTAQAAAWHLANGLTWEYLAAKNRFESPYADDVKYFSKVELQGAWLLSRHCMESASSLDQVTAYP
ncbi:MAG: hypothetical protein ABI557_20705, partial [Aureliella sp.]